VLKKLQRLTKSQKKLLSDNKFNDINYLVERNIPEGVMFVDRHMTHRLFYDNGAKTFHRLGI